MSRPTQQTFYLILPAQPPDVGSSIRPISRLVQEGEEVVRQRLLCPTFQVFRRFAQRANAEGLRSQLHALGISTFIVSDTEINGHLFLWGESANFGAGGLAFRDFGGQPLYCPFTDVVALTIGAIPREGADPTRFIDLHRKSTPITPRIDASLFDFDKFLNRTGATCEMFLDEVQGFLSASHDYEFDAALPYLGQAVASFAGHPGEYAPPAGKLAAPYRRDAVMGFNIYGLLFRADRLAQPESA